MSVTGSRLRISGIIALSLLLSFFAFSNTALAAPVNQGTPRFDFHLLIRNSSFSSSSPTSQVVPNDPPPEIPCLEVLVTLMNPHAGVLTVKELVQNDCSELVDSVQWSYYTVVNCGGSGSYGPSDGGNTGNLTLFPGTPVTVVNESWNAQCYVTGGFRSSYQIQATGVAFGKEITSGDKVTGQDTSQWYTFF